jgi:hypothetical protein
LMSLKYALPSLDTSPVIDGPLWATQQVLIHGTIPETSFGRVPSAQL